MVSELIITDQVQIKTERIPVLKMISSTIIAVSIFGVLACEACAMDKQTTNEKNLYRTGDRAAKRLYHGDIATAAPQPTPMSPMLKELKNNHLDVSSAKTIGDAFDAYTHATKKEWTETPGKNGSYYIDFVCMLKVKSLSSAAIREGVVTRKLILKFVIHKGGKTYIAMASRNEIMTDGMEHVYIIAPADIKKVVTAIYANQEIEFR